MGGCCAGSNPVKLSAAAKYKLPVIVVSVAGEAVSALIDTGCSKSIVREKYAPQNVKRKSQMVAFDGRLVDCKGNAMVQVELGSSEVAVEMVVTDQLLEGIDLIIGMDVISRVGGVRIQGEEIELGVQKCAAGVQRCESGYDTAEHKIDDKDFKAWFDGAKWIVEWKWKGDGPPTLTNKISLYDKDLPGEKQQQFEDEVNRWIDEGVLVPWDGEEAGVLALMAVVQQTKDKTRPVLDFREVNKSVESHTGSDVLDVCAERLREWRMVEGEVEIVDLKSAYLQVHVSKELWPYQLVSFKGKVYNLTRLGFGLASAPKVMSAILKYVLGQDPTIERATSSYIDDILVCQSKASSAAVSDHLLSFGLVCKPPEKLEGGAVLGLRIVKGKDGELEFIRGNQVPESEERSLTKRQLFSLCGKLVGHYPIASWLRVACSYIKRQASGERWDDPVGPVAQRLLNEVLDKVKAEDPVRGRWRVPKGHTGVVWTDASNLALGVVVEVGGRVVEDAAWLRKQTDYSHINVAELDAVIKGLNLAIKWGLKDISLMIDSSTVVGWVNLTLTDERRVKTKGAEEILIKRRLGVLRSLVAELGLAIRVNLVSSSKNKADVMTRVVRRWLDRKAGEELPMGTAAVVDIRRGHNQHHMGIDRTLFALKQVDPSVTRQAVTKIVKSCERCQSIDPAPVTHSPGFLSVDSMWTRLAIDVTHYRGLPYLSMVDCGPSRFAIWRELKRENSQCIIAELEEVFMERGPVNEILMDNATVFRSEEFSRFLQTWKVRSWYRAAYRASGNGIVERHHRTIKAIAERAMISPLKAVYWYNTTPRSGQKAESVPYKSLFSYEWRHPDVEPLGAEQADCQLKIGDEVWIKPGSGRCTEQWGRGVITNVNSGNNVSVNGMPRHILDVRPVVDQEELSDGDESSDDHREYHSTEEPEQEQAVGPRYPVRDRRPPSWLSDYQQ